MNVRDHLANERTFLAWVRTSIALFGFGVLIVKLRFLGISPQGGVRSARLGLTFSGVGLLTMLLAAWHYARTRRMIESGNYQSSSHLILAFAVVVIGLGLVSIAYLLALLK